MGAGQRVLEVSGPRKRVKSKGEENLDWRISLRTTDPPCLHRSARRRDRARIRQIACFARDLAPSDAHVIAQVRQHRSVLEGDRNSPGIPHQTHPIRPDERIRPDDETPIADTQTTTERGFAAFRFANGKCDPRKALILKLSAVTAWQAQANQDESADPQSRHAVASLIPTELAFRDS